MEPHDDQDRERDQDPEREEDPKRVDARGSLRRTTEQGDDLTEEHSLAVRKEREEQPYAPPRQPAQDPPT